MDLETIANCPMFQIPGLPPWAGPALCVGYAILETWLGKTDKVEAGSVLEGVFNIVRAAFRKKLPPPT